MNIVELAKQHVQQITGNNATGFGVPITFTAPTGETFTDNGLHSRISYAVDLQGNVLADGRKSHVSMAQQRFIDHAYPYRDEKGEVNFRMHKVSAADSGGVMRNYLVKNFYPDETLGLYVCILDDAE